MRFGHFPSQFILFFPELNYMRWHFFRVAIYKLLLSFLFRGSNCCWLFSGGQFPIKWFYWVTVSVSRDICFIKRETEEIGDWTRSVCVFFLLLKFHSLLKKTNIFLSTKMTKKCCFTSSLKNKLKMTVVVFDIISK